MKDLLGDTPLPMPTPHRAFDGATYNSDFDYERLSGQLKAVYDLMRDGKWRTLPMIAKAVEGSPQAVSARLRDLRKRKYGSLKVERSHVGNGVWEYRVGGRG